MNQLIDRIKKILRHIQRFNLREHRFRRNIGMPLDKIDENLQLIALRYFSHQLDKTIKNYFNPKESHGKDNYYIASSIFQNLRKSIWAESPDVLWAGRVLERYRAWISGEQEHFVQRKSKLKELNYKEFSNLKNIFSKRQSVRFWHNSTIPRELIEEVIEIGLMAPSSCNRQPWRFVVVENSTEVICEDSSTNKNMLNKAPYILYICVDERLFIEKYAAALDVGLSVSNILLGLSSLGLGACCIYQGETVNQSKIKKALNLPSYYYIYLAVPFGIPAEVVESPRRGYLEQFFHFVRADNTKILA